MITAGRLVQYRLSSDDAKTVARTRTRGRLGPAPHPTQPFPMIVTEVADDGTVSGTVFLGPDTVYVRGVTEGIDGGHWAWPERHEGAG